MSQTNSLPCISASNSTIKNLKESLKSHFIIFNEIWTQDWAETIKKVLKAVQRQCWHELVVVKEHYSPRITTAVASIKRIQRPHENGGQVPFWVNGKGFCWPKTVSYWIDRGSSKFHWHERSRHSKAWTLSPSLLRCCSRIIESSTNN